MTQEAIDPAADRCTKHIRRSQPSHCGLLPRQFVPERTQPAYRVIGFEEAGDFAAFKARSQPVAPPDLPPLVEPRVEGSRKRSPRYRAKKIAASLVARRHRALAIAALLFSGSGALAYTAAGDRIFPATLLLPQSAPADQLYVTPVSLPTNSGRATTATVTYGKTITDDLGFQVEDDLASVDGTPAPERSAPGHLVVALKYRAVLDRPREFFLTLAVDQEFAGTGPRAIGVDRESSTMPTVYFGKGFGDLDLKYLRPLAVIGMARYQVADGPHQPNRVLAGVSLQYSIPYLESKVASLDLPDFLRHTTPMVEALVAAPTGENFGVRTTGYIAPGFSYAGNGWELGLEALLPINHASGHGVGVMAQLYFSLDYLFADSPIGRPLI